MPFRSILKTLATSQGALVRGAVFCDELGERVERWAEPGAIDLYELDVAGASFAPIVAQHLPKGVASRLRVVVDDGVVWLGALANGYYLVVLARRSPQEARLRRALDDALGALIAHM
jgi:hypothetical protein